MASALEQIRTQISSMFDEIDAAHESDADEATVFWTRAQRRMIKIKLLLATAPQEQANELTRLKMFEGQTVVELLQQVESEIQDGINGGGLTLQRVNMDLPFDTAHDLDIYSESESEE